MKFLLLVLAIGLAAAAPADPVKPLADDCSFTLTGDGGTFTSPNFPENYGSNSNCSWLIITAGGTAIALRFDSFLTEPNSDVVQVSHPMGPHEHLNSIKLLGLRWSDHCISADWNF
jgi:CUB domain